MKITLSLFCILLLSLLACVFSLKRISNRRISSRKISQSRNAMNGINTAQAGIAQITQTNANNATRVPSLGVSNIWTPIMNDMMNDMLTIQNSYEDPDIDFCTEMIPHHWAAIFMCEEELKMSQSDIIKNMCKNIQWTQLEDIALMENFLKSQGVNYVDPSLTPDVNYVIQWDGETYAPEIYMKNEKTNWQLMSSAIAKGMTLQQFEAQNGQS